MADAKLQVIVTSPTRVLFDGTVKSLEAPGERGTFEVLPLHRAFASRLVSGLLVIDGKPVSIRRGALRVADDVVTAVVELP